MVAFMYLLAIVDPGNAPIYVLGILLFSVAKN